MAYTTIEGVEIVTAGIEWPASTGPATITFEHLADAVLAANEDPHIRPARVKLGHGVQLVGSLGDHDPFWDGQPAFGSLANLRLENDGAVLVADLVEVPDWLAEAAPSAFPSRSMECVWDVTTEGGKHYRMVLTGLALLGTVPPAVSDLEDLQRLLTVGPELERTPMPQTDASVDVDVVRRRFNYEWAIDPDSFDGADTYWWWARSIRVDPSEIVADDDEGGLWLIPFSTDGADEVTFGEPTPVRETFVPVNASVGAMTKTLTERHGQRVVAAQLSRPEKAEPEPAAGSEPENDPEEGPMSTIDIPALRTRLDLSEEELPDDATPEQINQALAAEVAEPEPGPEAEEPEDEPQEPEAVEHAEPPLVSVSREVWETTRRQAADGAAARAEQVTERREAILSAAVNDGRIAPAELDAWRTKLQDDDPAVVAAAEDTLAALPKGLVPVGEEHGVAHIDNGAEMEAIRASFGLTQKEG